MEIKYDVSITAIGNLARTFLENNNSAILLDEGIRPNLSDMSSSLRRASSRRTSRRATSC